MLQKILRTITITFICSILCGGIYLHLYIIPEYEKPRLGVIKSIYEIKSCNKHECYFKRYATIDYDGVTKKNVPVTNDVIIGSNVETSDASLFMPTWYTVVLLASAIIGIVLFTVVLAVFIVFLLESI